MQLAKKITVDQEGLLIDGERFPYYLADPLDDPLVVKRWDSLCKVTVTLLADAVEVIEDGLYVGGTEAETRVVGMKRSAVDA